MAKRYLYLVRHGQYDPEVAAPDQLGSSLSKLGRQQAKITAKAMSDLPIAAIHYSTLRRAAETAEPFFEIFPDAKQHRSQRLWEAIPCVPVRHADHFAKMQPDTLAKEQERAEGAFQHYFKATRGEDKHEILISHGNLIRYFVCCTLGVATNAWLNMECHNCGITRMVIEESGTFTLVSYNDIGHLPAKLRTDNFYL